MNYLRRQSLAVLGVFAVTLLVPFTNAFAKGSPIRFAASVVSVEQTSDTEAIVTVGLQSFEIPIHVNADTEIEFNGDEVGIDGLSVGAFIKVAGFFSAEGIVAEEINILDILEGQFRLRGTITSAGPVSSRTLITLLGVDVVVTTGDTEITLRGSDELLTPDSLTEGTLADVAGIFDDDQLVATRVRVGSRASEAITVEFEGTITAIDGSFLQVDTDGGGNAAVIITDLTRVGGELAIGAFVEVKGTLNEALAVVADSIKVDIDGDGDADDDHPETDRETTKTRRRVPLERVTDRVLQGEVETEFLETPSGERLQELEISFHRAERNEEFTLRVTFASGEVVDFGAIRANGGGRVKVKFRNHGGGGTPNILGLLPGDETVQDVVSVQVLDVEGNVILTGTLE